MICDAVKLVPTDLLNALAALWDETDVSEETRQRRPLDWNVPADLDWSRVEARARTYLAKIPPAVAGQNGHTRTFCAAKVLVISFSLSPDRAFALLSEWNERCSPPWEHDELMRKVREADEKGKGVRGEFLRPLIRERRQANKSNKGNPGNNAAPIPQENGSGQTQPTAQGAQGTDCTTGTPFLPGGPVNPEPVGVTCELWNFHDEPNPNSERGEMIRVGYSVQNIVAQLNEITRDSVTGDVWPKRMGQLLFAIRNHRPVWIRSTSALFAWISSRLAGQDNGIHWAEGNDKVKQSQLFDYLMQTAPEFETVELYPHEPPMPQHCYVHEPMTGGDGVAFSDLLSRFLPATEIDAMLIRAFFITLLWGGLPGQRPAWLFTCADDDARGGRGIGKSTIAQIGARLVGGYVSLSANESFGDVQRRLLSPVALEKRVVLLDNIKSLRFSWGELEGLITDTTISGRQMHTGEGQRPNTLVWVLTFNGASLSQDLAQRCIVVKLKRPKYVGRWMADTISFLDANRTAILGDIIKELRRPVVALEPRSRWGSWEQEVLARIEDPQRCQDVIAERSTEADDDREEMETVREAFRELISRMEALSPDRVWVHIPSHLAADTFNTATGEKRTTMSAMKMIYLLRIPEITKKTSHNGGRGCTWKGVNTEWSHARVIGTICLQGQTATIEDEPYQ